MSGHSYDSQCPKCSNTMDSYSDHKPYEFTEHECFNCGFYTRNTEGRYDLQELNEYRADYYERFPCKDHEEDLGDFDCPSCYRKSQLKELPKWRKEYI